MARDRYMTFAMQVNELSKMLGMQSQLNGLIGEGARRLAHMKLKPDDKKWVAQTQLAHAKPILKAIKQAEASIKKAEKQAQIDKAHKANGSKAKP